MYDSVCGRPNLLTQFGRKDEFGAPGEIDCELNRLLLNIESNSDANAIILMRCCILDSLRYEIDLRKSLIYIEGAVRPDTIRTSLDIPVELHQKLHQAAERRGCSARQLILRSIERVISDELPPSGKRVKLPLVPARGRQIRPVTNDEALFS